MQWIVFCLTVWLNIASYLTCGWFVHYWTCLIPTVCSTDVLTVMKDLKPCPHSFDQIFMVFKALTAAIPISALIWDTMKLPVMTAWMESVELSLILHCLSSLFIIVHLRFCLLSLSYYEAQIFWYFGSVRRSIIHNEAHSLICFIEKMIPLTAKCEHELLSFITVGRKQHSTTFIQNI